MSIISNGGVSMHAYALIPNIEFEVMEKQDSYNGRVQLDEIIILHS